MALTIEVNWTSMGLNEKKKNNIVFLLKHLDALIGENMCDLLIFFQIWLKFLGEWQSSYALIKMYGIFVNPFNNV